ncbi:MAG TPA: DUF555 domain-containing protein [Candidatus Methanoperedenaceae archaeon]|nr:DUF555 domain-containing protein [Candidatus Methanoperedenaceae archaeon]
MPNYRVTLEAAWIVRDVRSTDDAMNVAIAEAGKMLNPKKLDFVDVEVSSTECPSCGAAFDSVFLTADTALVGLQFSMKVFDAETEEHAARIARSVIGKALPDVPLNVIEVEKLEPA